MDIQKMIAELTEERACLDDALIGLEKLAQKRTPRRGRPPKWLRPTVIAETRKVNGGLNGNGATNGRRHAASISSAN
jgi:hypothetical protein